MSAMSPAAPLAVSNSVTYQGPAQPRSPDTSTGLSFGEVMSDLNPLQYLPVVGTIYRAITGDTIPRPLREAGSLLVSGLMGGPVGVATNLAMLGFEKLTGIDLEEVEQRVITALTPSSMPALSPTLLQTAAVEGAGAGAPSVPTGAAATGTASTVPAPGDGSAAGAAWSPAQLAAYGVIKGPDGDLRQGNLTGADVLNALQLRANNAALPTAA
jgi:hypothetical protein